MSYLCSSYRLVCVRSNACVMTKESFMHEPLGRDQRPCARGAACECMFVDPSNPFVCTEFLLPGTSSLPQT